MLGAPVVVDLRADQEGGKIRSRLTAVKREISIGCAGIAFIDLQVAELAAELECMGPHGFRNAVGKMKGIVGLKSRECVNADSETIEVYGRDRLRESRRP